MEFSLAQSLDGYSEQLSVPFPHLKSDPATDHVNPGLGQIVNLYDTIVPLKGYPVHSIQKKVEESEILQTNDEITQTGGGKTSINPALMNSFLHPIVTDSIIFPKREETKSKKRNQSQSDKTQRKRAKIEHKFHVV